MANVNRLYQRCVIFTASIVLKLFVASLYVEANRRLHE